MEDSGFKDWDTLEREMAGIRIYLCGQGFAETKADIQEDEGIDEDDFLKYETVFRMLDGNIDYGRWDESREPEDRPDDVHSQYMEIRELIATAVTEEWLKAGGTVHDMDSAQAFADGYIRKEDFRLD